jgi:hypothetical protein
MANDSLVVWGRWFGILWKANLKGIWDSTPHRLNGPGEKPYSYWWFGSFFIFPYIWNNTPN